MRIAIFGAGGVGGYYGARLAAAGEEVHIIARGAHLNAIREHGLRVASPLGDIQVRPSGASDDADAIGVVDYVLFAVKLYDTEAAAEACRSLVGSETTVISFQNGVTAVDALSAILGRERVMGGVTYILSFIEAPGVIAHKSQFARLVFGELDGARTERAEAFLNACTEAEIDAALSDDVAAEIWTKFATLAPLAGMTALCRVPLGPIRRDPDAWAMFRAAVEEVVAVARACDVALGIGAVDVTVARIEAMGDTMASSMLYDLEGGRPLELEWLSGAVVRLGRQHGVATPIHAAISAALKPHAAGRVVD